MNYGSGAVQSTEYILFTYNTFKKLYQLKQQNMIKGVSHLLVNSSLKMKYWWFAASNLILASFFLSPKSPVINLCFGFVVWLLEPVSRGYFFAGRAF